MSSFPDHVVDDLAAEEAVAPLEAPSRLRTVRQILAAPGSLKLPDPVVPQFVWPGRSTLLASREKAGKSTLAAQAAAAVARGGEFLDGIAAAGEVLWLAVEEHPGDVARRFATHEVTSEGVADIHILDRTEGDPLEDLESQAQAVRPALVVVDTLAAFARDANAESGNASAWLPIVQGLTDIARRTDAGLFLLHHARKSDGQYRDSTAIGAGVDVIAQMFEERVPTERRIEVKGRYSRETFVVNFEGGVYVPVGAGRTLPERIMAFLRAAPESSKSQVADAVRGKRAEILRALDQLVDRAVVELRKDGQAKRYSLAGEPVPSSEVGVWDREPVPEKGQREQGGNGSGTDSGTGSPTSSFKDHLKGEMEGD